MAKLKGALSCLGSLAINTAEFLEFNHYTFDEIADIGAMKFMFAAKDDGLFYEVYGDFICGTGDNVIVEVTGVCEVAKGSDGDIETLSDETLKGVTLALPYACVLAVLTTVHDTLKYDTEVDAFELLINNA